MPTLFFVIWFWHIFILNSSPSVWTPIEFLSILFLVILEGLSLTPQAIMPPSRWSLITQFFTLMTPNRHMMPTVSFSSFPLIYESLIFNSPSLSTQIAGIKIRHDFTKYFKLNTHIDRLTLPISSSITIFYILLKETRFMYSCSSWSAYFSWSSSKMLRICWCSINSIWSSVEFPVWLIFNPEMLTSF